MQTDPISDLLAEGTLTVAEAGSKLIGYDQHYRKGRRFLALPVQPTGYAMTWLIGPADAPLHLPNDLAVVLRFSGSTSRQTQWEVLDFWAGQTTGEPWVVVVDGPVIEDGKYELSGRHQWKDGIDAAVWALNQFGKAKGRKIELFCDCPVPLAFAVAGQLREMVHYRLYQFNRGGGESGETYHLVYER